LPLKPAYSDLLVIDPGRKKDLEAVFAIEQASFSHPWTRAMFQEELAKIPATLYVLKGGSEKVALGYCCFWALSGELQLVNIAVRPDLRGQGLGRLLLHYLFREAQLRAAEKIFLEVRPSNQAAVGLYERLGFKVLYRRPRYYTPEGEDALVMVWDSPYGKEPGRNGMLTDSPEVRRQPERD
jgi:ribosomal-protein-alanine N-acetyltransferase